MSALTRDEVLDLCSSLPGAVEDYPFGDDVAVFKVAGKMFALVLLAGEPGSVRLKCDPEWALELRAVHETNSGKAVHGALAVIHLANQRLIACPHQRFTHPTVPVATPPRPSK